MSITVTLDLADRLVEEAQANGLLESSQIGDLLSAELQRRQAASELHGVLNKVRAQAGEPMSADEIQAEVNAVRAERRARREAGR